MFNNVYNLVQVIITLFSTLHFLLGSTIFFYFDSISSHNNRTHSHIVQNIKTSSWTDCNLTSGSRDLLIWTTVLYIWIQSKITYQWYFSKKETWTLKIRYSILKVAGIEVHLGTLRLMHADFSIIARMDAWAQLIKNILFN